MDPNMQMGVAPAPKKKMAVAVRKRSETYEVAVIEGGEVQGVLVAKDVSELLPYLFGPLETAAPGAHLLFEITVR